MGWCAVVLCVALAQAPTSGVAADPPDAAAGVVEGSGGPAGVAAGAADAAPDAGEAPGDAALAPPLPEAPDAGVAVEAPEAPDAGLPAEVADAPDAGPPSRETTVVGRRLVDVRRVAGSAQVIGKDELERREQNDVARVLQSVPGVYVREEDGFGLRPNIGMRGVNADRSSKVTLMEDGVLFGPAPYSAPAAYYSPLVTRMVAIEVFKGPASIQFGPQTIGGAINYRTRPLPQQFEADLDLSLGNYGAGKAHGVVGYGTGRWGVLAEGVHLQTTGFRQLDGGGDTGFDKNEVMLKGGYASDPSAVVRHAVELKLGYATERSNETYLGLSDADFAAAPLRRYAASARDQMTWWRTQAQLTHRLEVGDWLDVTTTAYRHDFERTWRRFDRFAVGPDPYRVLAYPVGTNAYYRALLAGEQDGAGPDDRLVLVDNQRTFASQGVQLNAQAQLRSGPVAHELELGLRFHHDEIRRRHTGAAFDLVNATLVPAGVDDELLASNVAFTRAFSAYLTDRLTWGRLLVSPGVRVELPWMDFGDALTGRTSATQQVVPLLGVGAVYAFDVGLSVLAGVHQGFSPVAPGQDPSVEAERALNTEAGLRFARGGLRAELIGFWSEYQNVTGECTGSTGCTSDALNQQFNGGRARVLGAEALASARRRLPRGVVVHADLAYTFTWATFTTTFLSDNPIWGAVDAGDQLPYVPMHQGQLRLRAQKGPFELGVGAMYYGEVREVAGQGEVPEAQRVPGRFLVDLTASAELGGGRLYLTLTNLLNQPALVSRKPFGARPQAPLLAQVGFKYAFR